jgi:hypothetical protein
MASTFNALPVIGVDFTLRTAAPDFALGTPAIGNKSDTWIYVLSSGTVATGTCTVSGSGGFIVTDAAGSYTADTAFAASEYGWVRLTDSPLLNPD